MNHMRSFVTCTLLMVIILTSADVTHGGQARRRRSSSGRAGTTKSVNSERKPLPTSPAPAAVTTASGLTYVITRRGTGRQPKAGETVVVHYTGTLTNGVKFDSSRDRNEPIEFPLGAGRVIKGWDEGIAQLRVGDQAVLIIPPQLGYGARGAGDGLIPAEATLVFIVELVEVR